MSAPTDDQRELYNAYSQSYAAEANRRAVTFWIDLGFAGLASIVAFLVVTHRAEGIATFLKDWTPVAALLWLTVRELLMPTPDRDHRRSAVMIQEQFDLTFWKGSSWLKSWNEILCGRPVQQRIIKDLARAFRGTPLDDGYWIGTDGIEANAAALLRIKQSAAWGATGHSRYSRLNRRCAIGVLVVLVTGAVIAGVSTRGTAAVLMGFAPFLVGRLQSAREQAALAKRREDLEEHVHGVLHGSRRVRDGDVRAAQDQLCRLRLEQRRVPGRLYLQYLERDRSTVDAALEREAAEVLKLHPASSPSTTTP